eukprot:m.80698 g.80698  ORF g.80698 m.80698 type:complete len:387 (-) comp14559_c0_seq2:91-1251(-)
MMGKPHQGAVSPLWLMATLSLCVVGFGDETHVRLHIDLPKDPSMVPANLSVSFNTLERDGNFSMLFWWCDPRLSLPDERIITSCPKASVCKHELSHQYLAGNCTTRLQVWHDREPTWDWGTDEHNIFIKAHLSGMALEAPLYVATNESALITVGVLPAASLTGTVYYNYSFEHFKHTTISSINHTYSTPGEQTISVLADNGISNITRTRSISVEDPIKGLNVSQTKNRTQTDVTVTFTCELVQGTNVSYRWDFNDGSSANTTSPSIKHHFKKPGLYNVTIFAANHVNHLNETLAVLVTPAPATHAARNVAITVPIVLALLGTVCVAMVVRYRRWIFRSRGVESAEFSFLDDSTDSSTSPRTSWLPWQTGTRTAGKNYGTVEMFDDL